MRVRNVRMVLLLAVSMMDSMNSCMEEYVRSGLKLGATVSSAPRYDANDGKPHIKISVANTGKMPLTGITLSVMKATTPSGKPSPCPLVQTTTHSTKAAISLLALLKLDIPTQTNRLHSHTRGAILRASTSALSTLDPQQRGVVAAWRSPRGASETMPAEPKRRLTLMWSTNGSLAPLTLPLVILRDRSSSFPCRQTGERRSSCPAPS